MPGEGHELTRRAALLSGVGGLVGFLAACSSSAPATRSSSPITGTLTSAPSSTGLASATALGAKHVAAAEQVSVEDATRFQGAVQGTWRGGWRDTTGAHGTSDFTITLDARNRAVRATVAAVGPIVAGAALPTAEYTIDLLGFARSGPSWTVDSPQLGSVTFDASGGTNLSGTATGVPGHPEIAKIELSGTRTGRRVDGTYTITKSDGSTIRGTTAWTAAGTRAVPADPSASTHDTPADVASGAYAQSLVTADELTKAMQRPVGAPTANGGRLEAYAGIDASNALATTSDHDLRVAWTVYLGHTVEAISTFFGSALHGQRTVAGPWQHAYFLSDGASELYAYSGDRMLQVAVQQEVGAPVPSVQLVRDRTLAVAKVLFAKLDTH